MTAVGQLCKVWKLLPHKKQAVIVVRGGTIEVEHLPQPAATSLIDPTSVDLPLDEAIAKLIERWTEAKLADALETQLQQRR